jgi:mono/diheme cytochrome c family protein
MTQARSKRHLPPRQLLQGLLAGTLALLTITGVAAADSARRDGAQQDMIDRGRYLMKIAGCNDCHTAGYAQSGGDVPEAQWLAGDALGWNGPWGTTYAANLRLVVAAMSEEEWVSRARTARYRPPMPWFALRDMTEADLRAAYRYIRSLGPAGSPVPVYVPPGDKVAGPVVMFPQPPK